MMNSLSDRLEYFKNKDIGKIIERDMQAFRILIPEACIDFINKYCFTFDPRLQGSKVIPFLLYEKQRDFVTWLIEKYKNKQDGLVEKARDVGATWTVIAVFIYLILFHNDISLGVYSYKEPEVDKIGDISTLLGKARFLIKHLPERFTSGMETRFMYMRNRNTGSDIAGSSGDNPGRGGRRSMFFKDECAFYPRPELIEASLSETSDCKIDVSTHSGTNTIFHTKCIAGAMPIFRFNWFDIPSHTKELYEAKKQQAIANGLLHVFNREIDINPSASIDSVVIPSEWVNAAKENEYNIPGRRIAALDVADEGMDTNAIVIMEGNTLIHIDEWGEGDTTETARKAFWKAVDFKCNELRFDCIGVGAGIKGATNDIMKQENLSEDARHIEVIGWAASSAVKRPDDMDYQEKTNRELFENAKAQAYWKVREEFRNTYRAIEGKDHDASQILTLKENGNPLLVNKLVRELSQPQHKLSASGKYVIDKKPRGTKSPNLCDAFVMARAEVEHYMEWAVI